MTWTTSILVALIGLIVYGAISEHDRRVLRQESAAALCLPTHPGEIAHTSMEPNGSLRCAVMRKGQLVTRMEIE
jgi:hypothetical protein